MGIANKQNTWLRGAALATALCAYGSAAMAHHTYNVTGYAGTLDPVYTLGGLDGYGFPAPTYAGGSGPAGNTTGSRYYGGALPVSWLAAVHAHENEPGDVYALSTADALVKGAPANYLLAAGGISHGTGLDFGLLRIDNPNFVQVTVTADASLDSGLQPYIALYAGWDASWTGAEGTVQTLGGTSSADRLAAYTPGADDPLGSSGLVFLAAASGLDTAVLLFESTLASAHYTLVVGGLNGTAGAYTAIVETVAAPVPLPAAVWLLASALTGLATIGRRKATA